MPCFETRRISLNLQSVDRTLMRNAVKSLGLSIVNDTAHGLAFETPEGAIATVGNGTIDINEGELDLVNKLKVAYSRECVMASAKRFGWAARSQGVSVIRLTKRGV